MDSNTIPVCLKCFQFPIINFITSTPGSIYIKCQCGFSKTMTIKDYLSKVSTVDTSKIELMCNKHNEPFMKYCVNCNIHYCSECENEKEYAVHSNEDHNAYFNQDYKEEDKKKIIEHGKEVIEKGNKYLTETLPAIRTKFSEASNKEIDDAYKTCIENNTQILHLIELIIKHFSFESFHYNLEPASWASNKFDFADFVPTSDKNSPSVPTQLVTFFKTLCIYRDTVTLDQIKQVKLMTEGDQPIVSAIRLSDTRILY